MNPLSLLHLQNKSYDPRILNQAQEIFEIISRAILDDKHAIEYSEEIFAVNQFILLMKGYFIVQDASGVKRIVWDDCKL